MPEPRHPLDASGTVELAALERGGMIESRHLGAAIVVDRDGGILRVLGDVGADIYPRSALKPVQALAVMRAGVALTGADAVLAAASHSGTERHVAVVTGMLAAVGLDESALQCPVAWPGDSASRLAARSSGAGMRRAWMNCSGKHAAFLMACVHRGWPLGDYLDPEHPLQRSIRSTVEELSGEPVGPTAVDGCGAPVFATSVRGLATAIGRITGARSGPAATLARAVLAEPWAIDGPGRANTIVSESLGVVAKGGAEGVIAIGTTEGTAVAVKVLDGAPRATTMIALELLASVGAIEPDAARRAVAATTEPVSGGDAVVGRLRVSF